MNCVDILLKHNKQQSQRYRSPGATLARKQYEQRHPTAICAYKCMDGRLNFAVMANVEPGIIQPWRNLGGKFDLGWTYFGRLVLDWTNKAVKEGRDCLQ